MRRIVVTMLACAAALASVVAAWAAEGPSGGTTLTRLVACDTNGPDRSATFLARMDAVPAAARMAMRFQLLEKLGSSGEWTKVDVPALRQWRRAAPGVKSFAYRQTVDALRAGGAYKARVIFRWTTPAGAAVQTQTRDTPVCRGAVPNLTIAGVDVRPGPTADTRVYRVTVGNAGKGEADAIDVVLSVDRAVLDTVTVDQLDAGDSRTLSFTGPACQKSLRVRVDPDNTIGETAEGDNTRLFACPPGH